MNKLFLLVGCSGSGKSTYAADFCFENPDVIYLNADKLRGVIGEDESDQSKNHVVFDILFKMTEYFLKLGKDVLLDNTNYSKKNRKQFVEIARKHGVKIRAYVFKTPYEVCITRNEARDRKVPIHVIKNQFDKFEEPGLDEVDEIVYI